MGSKRNNHYLSRKTKRIYRRNAAKMWQIIKSGNVGNPVQSSTNAEHANANRKGKRLEQNNGIKEESAPDSHNIATSTWIPGDRPHNNIIRESEAAPSTGHLQGIRMSSESQQQEISFVSHVENESSSLPSEALHEDEVLLPIKTEPKEEDYTVVIQDPISMETVEGTYQELFCETGGDPDPEDRGLVIDLQPPKKKRQKKVLDLEYYKKELHKCRKELKITKQELRQSKQKLSYNDLELAKKDKEILKRNVKIEQLRKELNQFKKDILQLEKKLVSMEDLLTARQSVGGKINDGVVDSDINSDSAKCFFKESTLILNSVN